MRKNVVAEFVKNYDEEIKIAKNQLLDDETINLINYISQAESSENMVKLLLFDIGINLGIRAERARKENK